MDIEDELFETLDIVEVAINNIDNEFRKIITNKGVIILQKILMDDLTIDNTNMK